MEQTTGKRLSELRKAKGLSVEEFAAKLGVKPSAVYGLQSDANKPSFDTMASIVRHFPDVSLDWLLTGNGPMLRDGRALTPAATPAKEAAPDRPEPLRTEAGQVDFVNKYITRLENDLDAAAEREAYYQARIQELLGKPSGSLTPAAAEPRVEYTASPAPIGPRFDCVVRAMWPAQDSVEVTPAYAVGY